ncbi:NADPH:quinone reductase [Halocatena marina]|uniref:NADPH:quinone reductase n=1 Tax=Halocatena marina TaxID=2934937 RepID=A0ABD5YI14_9EURY|nr:NADPH:quinone reductase [Halocatena marina]
MRAVRFHDHGDPDVLVLDEIEPPEPDHGDVRVTVRAAAVNPVDTYFRTGEYEPPELPMIPGTDLAGVVDSVGDGVSEISEGDRVFATGLGSDRLGTYAEQVTVPADRLAHLPADVSFEIGAAAGVVVGTSWRALVDYAALEPTETCLIHGANGGVGHVAVQLAATIGARVIGTARPPYHDQLESLGATTVLDYTRDDLAEAVDHAPDVILETRADENLQFDADVAATGARVICIGNATEHAELTAIGAAKSKDVCYQFMTLFNAPDLSAILDRTASLLERGAVVPAIARRYDLDEAAEAQRAVMEESLLGKIVLVP